MKTVTLQIGNTDDKLTQKDWSMFVTEVAQAIAALSDQIHFSGSSTGAAPWQNAAWVFAPNDGDNPTLRLAVTNIRKRYNQDSVAWTEGETEFI